MASLTDRLKALGVKIGAADLQVRPKGSICSIDDVIDGEIRDTRYGQTFIVETFYPVNYQQGLVHLAFPDSLKRLSTWVGDPELAHYNPGSFLFLDTETSGLAGGAGTLVFLIGIGRFTAEGFRLIQLFLRDPSEEAAHLQALLTEINDFKALVTYNGKAFDVPLINTRLILNGENRLFIHETHLDLLALARKLWRDRLISRSLGKVETDILGVVRTEEDIPGWMIPEMYFNYLKTHDARPLRSVFYHNAMDLLSLAALFNKTAMMLEDPDTHAAEEPIDLIAIGKFLEELGLQEEAVSCYTKGLCFDLPTDIRKMALRRWSYLEKRRENLTTSIDLWQQAANENEIYAYIELAKIFEHRIGDYRQAIHWTEGAISLLNSNDLPAFERNYWLPELEHRLRRLHKKAGLYRGEM